ncbi:MULTISPECIES: SoxR reducing system RseC family protein [Metabacillus]|uniref:SoxR reducing system RseC family protein n=1 Tax=Metabacillus TaxID=2675233 RepID=UPI000AE7E8B2|nr:MULTISPECIES: SoxR reducing system RseC family protein [Metabacillus]MDX8290018.1 SoxR reducing system RseC family protein [Metabacillus indicus]
MRPLFFVIIGAIFLLQIPLWITIVSDLLMIAVAIIGLTIILASKWLSRKSGYTPK